LLPPQFLSELQEMTGGGPKKGLIRRGAQASDERSGIKQVECQIGFFAASCHMKADADRIKLLKEFTERHSWQN
jgi:hypothetical protein